MSISSKSGRDNRANQLNPTHPTYHRSRGADPGAANQQASTHDDVRDNRANQLNPNNDTYVSSRDGDGVSDKASNMVSGRPE